jgi:hypothetical protein
VPVIVELVKMYGSSLHIFLPDGFVIFGGLMLVMEWFKM